MRYLLDELMSYEEGFTDIMMKDRVSERHETFMGIRDPEAPVCQVDLAAFEQRLVEQVNGALQSFTNGSNTLSCK